MKRNKGADMGNGINRGDYYKRLARQRAKLFAKLSHTIVSLHLANAKIERIMRVVELARRVERSWRVYEMMALTEEL